MTLKERKPFRLLEGREGGREGENAMDCTWNLFDVNSSMSLNVATLLSPTSRGYGRWLVVFTISFMEPQCMRGSIRLVTGVCA